MINRAWFAEAMKALSNAYHKPFTDDSLLVYYGVLGHFSEAALEYAILETLKTFPFCQLPPPAVLHIAATSFERKRLNALADAERLELDRNGAPLSLLRDLLRTNELGCMPARDESRKAAQFYRQLRLGRIPEES